DGNRFERLKFEAAELRRRGRQGQRFEALEKLRQARQTWAAAWSSEKQRELRTEAIACLALTDLKEGRLGQENWEEFPPGTVGPSFDHRFDHYARSDAAGNITVRRVRNDEELAHLPNPQQPSRHAFLMQFSPDGKFLAVMHHTVARDEERQVRVW